VKVAISGLIFDQKKYEFGPERREIRIFADQFTGLTWF